MQLDGVKKTVKTSLSYLLADWQKGLMSFAADEFGFLFLLIFTCANLTACANPMGGNSSQIDADHLPGITKEKVPSPAKGAEFVAASSQMKLSLGGRFLLHGSLSNTSSAVLQTTSQRGYKLYSNVQGDLISGGKGL